MSTQPTAPPAYNPSAPQNGSPAVGFEQYQQGSFQQPASQYPPPPPYQPYPQQQYSNPSVPPYSQPPMGGPTYPPNQTTIYTQQPRTVYVYDQRGKRRNDTSDEDCLMLALCGACLCCCLMDWFWTWRTLYIYPYYVFSSDDWTKKKLHVDSWNLFRFVFVMNIYFTERSCKYSSCQVKRMRWFMAIPDGNSNVDHGTALHGATDWRM